MRIYCDVCEEQVPIYGFTVLDEFVICATCRAKLDHYGFVRASFIQSDNDNHPISFINVSTPEHRLGIVTDLTPEGRCALLSSNGLDGFGYEQYFCSLDNTFRGAIEQLVLACKRKPVFFDNIGKV